MPEPLKPTVKITLDRERSLHYNLNALESFQEATGKNLFDEKTVKQIQESITPRDIKALLWAGLIHEDKMLTLEQVGEMVHVGNIRAISAELFKAYSAVMPEVDKTEAPLA